MRLIIKSILSCLLILLITHSICVASDIGIAVEEQTIDIVTAENGLLVEENILFNNIGSENATSIKLWIQQGIKDLDIIAIETGENLNSITTGNTREINLSQNNLTIQPGNKLEILLSYTLPTNTENFEKTISYDISYISIRFNDEPLYQSQNVQSDSTISLRLYKPTEAPLSITYITIIFILVVILISIILFSLRKQRSKAKKSIIESEEILTTKKALLMSLLKDLEKQYRAKSISDDTYSKLKDEYKQQAVDVMRKLEDLK